MSNIEVRFSEEKDIQELVDLNNMIWNDDNAPAPVHYESVEEYVKYRPPGSQLVAVDEVGVCGYVNLKSVIPIPSNDHVAEMAIGVYPRCQGKGVGRLLIERCEEWAREQGKKKVMLRVMESNSGAIEFYKRMGYIEQGRLVKEFFLNGKYVDDIFMYKWLED